MIRFCHRIVPGAAILVPQTEPNWAAGRAPIGQSKALIALIQAIVESAVVRHGLSLLPMVAIGHGAGADLAAHVALSCGHLLTACLLLRPRQGPAIVPPKNIADLCVLLCLTRDPNQAKTAASQWHRVMLASGAQVVCERVRPRNRPGGRDAALCRVFLAALFGAPCYPLEETSPP